MQINQKASCYNLHLLNMDRNHHQLMSVDAQPQIAALFVLIKEKDVRLANEHADQPTNQRAGSSLSWLLGFLSGRGCKLG